MSEQSENMKTIIAVAERAAENNADWPVYDGPLGFSLDDDCTSFAVWAPSAVGVTIRLYRTDDLRESPNVKAHLSPSHDGAWSIEMPERLTGVYYDFEVCFEGDLRTVTSDPWGKASGANGMRSMVVDLDSTNPLGWEHDVSPKIPLSSTVVWETHVGDYSNDPSGGFPRKHRGKYLAFTDAHTVLSSCDGQPVPVNQGRRGMLPSDKYRDDASTGLDYLRQLGVTHIELMPIYDYGSVDETRGEQYNWGYDPVAYDVPEGSYSSDAHNGAVRIRECKEMIASLHRAGFRVIMDVVYNHMYMPDNSFERMVPGYFCRRTALGEFADGSGCGNDMASERPMFHRFMVESVDYWARQYHIDGFRFDLMGLIDTTTLNAIRASLDALPGGEDILMYGEPWSCGQTVMFDDDVVDFHEMDDFANGMRRTVVSASALGNKRGRVFLDSNIGWFSDEGRDAIKGNVFDHHQPGFVNGCAEEESDNVLQAANAWRGTSASGSEVRQIVQYVSAHDNLTLWDKLCCTMRDSPTQSDYQARGEVSDIFAANALAAGLVLTAAGIPFMLSGEEFARTKYGCDNSFDQGAKLNELDWSSVVRNRDLVDWYALLIGIRKRHVELYDGFRRKLPTTSTFSGVVSYAVNRLVMVANPTHGGAVVVFPDMPTENRGVSVGGGVGLHGDFEEPVLKTSMSSAPSWHIIADSARYCPWKKNGADYARVVDRDLSYADYAANDDVRSQCGGKGNQIGVQVPAMSFCIVECR